MRDPMSAEPPQDNRADRQKRTTGASGSVGKKKVFLVAAFSHPEPIGEEPVSGMAEDVVAVMGMAGQQKRFAWVGSDREDSIGNPAMVNPVRVRLAVASPWHDEDKHIVTGLVQLDPAQLGTGSIDEDIDHLLRELATSRDTAHSSRQADASGW